MFLHLWKYKKYLSLPNDYIFYHLNHHKLMGSVCRKEIIKEWERKVNVLPTTFSVHLNLKCFYVHLLVFTTKYVQIIHWNVFIIWNRMKWLNIFHFKRKFFRLYILLFKEIHDHWRQLAISSKVPKKKSDLSPFHLKITAKNVSFIISF